MKKGLGSKFLRKASRDRELVSKARKAKQLEVKQSVTDLTFREYIELVMPSFQFYAWNLMERHLRETVSG